MNKLTRLTAHLSALGMSAIMCAGIANAGEAPEFDENSERVQMEDFQKMLDRMRDLETRAGGQHPRFDARVFTDGERARIAASDTGDYLVRNLTGLDLVHSALEVGDRLPGQRASGRARATTRLLPRRATRAARHRPPP